MNGQFHTQRYPANWNLRFICDCKKKHPELKIYPATAKQLSPYGTRIQSTHNVCSNRTITLQLDVPPVAIGESSRTVEIIGRTIYTVSEGDHFITEIEFLRFDRMSQQILTQALAKYFDGPAD
jgi:hypothetical protein